MSIHDLQAKRRLQSLDALERTEWGPASHASSLVTTCHRLRTKPIGEFTIEELRIMIGQDIGSIFLVPLALEKLAADPLAEGNCYPGDLLCSLLGLSQDFWRRHSDLRSQLDTVIANTKEGPTIVDNALQAFHDRMD